MNPRPQPMLAIAVALLSLLGTAVNGLGFVASDLELTKLVRGLGFLAPLLLVGPLGVGLLVVGLLEAAAAVALLAGGVMLLCRRRAGTWVSALACVPGLLAGLLLVTQIVPAPLVFGKTMAGLPTQVVPWVIFVYSLITAISAVALLVSQPAHAGSGSPSRPCSMA
ncbi:hypothetical protein [Mycobacterium montefiorense]|uniref:Uncharacterized protein n=2 Tax=Mycobacterium montefiorense TaxID=154654 RepID=A0AA37UUM9_9MYCO|nr:hypothetical protein [Mycobacterium montefiorense]GKU47189.1 hypothetical protein NJB14194_38070 [Mycobacterium montefiorense]GKU53142.1 hypothetical protein NJB14195_43830 [Mycobacterium montefiorense]GKU62544.1 hypothetical protein NJB18182_30450 [Mycobacterium montefiorense]GKU66226.1 hypothetical protein NJB18183_13750 [Mycobacterium montefiorense]GKU73507.1 hypothetical protein NJB18185_32780 [Mycobacterium montefiorense]